MDTGTAQADLIRAALAGAGTCVWAWSVDEDHLSDIDDSLATLGYAAGAVGATQAAWDQLIHPDERAANHEAYLRHARGETATYEHAYRVRAANGRWHWMLERGRIVERHDDGRPRRVVGTLTDITERRAIVQEASEATARLERIARQVPGMLFQFDMPPGERGSFRYVSERGQDWFGLPPGQAMANDDHVWAAIDIEDRRVMAAALSMSARTLQEWRCEFRARRADGTVRWMLGTAMPERMADGRTVWSGYVQDHTEHRELDAARHDAAVADAANRAKTEFLARMSHELRTPLNAVLGFAQLMEIDQTEPPLPGQQRRLKLIRDAGEHLLQMISDLLDLTRIEAGSLPLVLEPVPLCLLAQQAMDMLRDSADRAQVRLVLRRGDEPVVLADRTRVRQVLLNLLGNAIKYNRPGGRVDLVLASGDARQAGFDVCDTGVGIAPEDLPQVFEPFQRGGQASGKVEGTGIGLAVTRSLVQLMKGSIDAASVPGAGSVFSVRLPRVGYSMT